MYESKLSLLKYSVDKIFFEVNDEYDYSKAKEIKLNQDLNKTINKIDENTFKTTLIFKIYGTEEIPVPFTLSISISGIFELEDWESEKNKQIAEKNTVAILFPFLRSLIATVTANCSVPPYVMPVINVNAFISDNK